MPTVRLLALAGVACLLCLAVLVPAGSADDPAPRSDQDPSYTGSDGVPSLHLALVTRSTRQMRRSSRLKLTVTVNRPVVVQVGAKVKPVAKPHRRHRRRRGHAARRRRPRTTTLKPVNLLFLVPVTKHVTFRLPRGLRKRLNRRRAKIVVSGTAVDAAARVTQAGLRKRLR